MRIIPIDNQVFLDRLRNMSKLIKLIILLIIFSNSFFCAGGKRYAYDRTMDATDIINLGVERNIYGISITLAPFIFGLQRGANGKGFGIRYGHFGTYETGDDESLTTVSYYTKDEMKQDDYLKLGDNWIGWLSAFHQPTGDISERNRKKNFKYARIQKCYNRYTIYYMGDNYKCSVMTPRNTFSYPVEISVGVYLGVRAGINLKELVDFFAGIIGYDPQEDDLLSVDPFGQN